MAYNNNIPQPGQLLAVSQAELLANFSEIATWLAADHNAFDTVNAGKHKKVNFIANADQPEINNGNVALYSKTSVLTGLVELFKVNSFGVENPADTANKAFPMTASQQALEGWSYLPSGLLMKWGRQNKSGQDTITYPVGANIPAFQVALFSMVSIFNSLLADPNLAVTLTSNNLTSLSILVNQRTTGNNATANVSYLSIGF